MTFLGNTSTKKVHDLKNEQENCQISEIDDDHKKEFDSLSAAHAEGFEDCEYCLGH